MSNNHQKELILWFDDIGIDDVPIVGGKNASLGEMYQHLSSRGVEVPHGFAITAYAYKYLMKETGVEQAISDTLADLDTHNLRNLQERGQKVRTILRNAIFPDDLKETIITAYQKMEKEYGKGDEDYLELVSEIDRRTSAYPDNKRQFFIDKIAEGVARIGAGFYPKDVIARLSDLVSHIFDERNDAVKTMVKMVINVAKRRKKKIGICGLAPSDFREFATFLVECGIDSMSLIPDTALKNSEFTTTIKPLIPGRVSLKKNAALPL